MINGKMNGQNEMAYLFDIGERDQLHCFIDNVRGVLRDGYLIPVVDEHVVCIVGEAESWQVGQREQTSQQRYQCQLWSVCHIF